MWGDFMEELLRLSNLSYTLPTGRQLFNDLTFIMSREKVGIVGRNGVGKSTLLRLIMKEIEPNYGECVVNGIISYVPQLFNIADVGNYTSRLKLVRRRINCLKINNNIKKIVEKKLQYCIYNIPSHGEEKMIRVLEAFLGDSDLIILDEPECSLDRWNRIVLRELISTSKSGILIVCHDGKIMENLDYIIEIREQGVRSYAGGFDDYIMQVKMEATLLKKELLVTKHDIEHIKNKGNREKNTQLFKMSKSNDDFFDKGYGDFWCDTPKKDRASRTYKRIKKIYEEKQRKAEQILSEYMDRATLVNDFKLPIPNTEMDHEKMVLQLKSISFGYREDHILFSDFNLTLYQGDKVAVMGDNGAGKSTLLKIIYGHIIPRGEVSRTWKKCVYLDQEVGILDLKINLVDNIINLYNLNDKFNVLSYLEMMHYPKTIAERQCMLLSGGELVVAALLMLLYDKVIPDVLLLDEPTNHLDLSGLNLLISLINSYMGCVVIVSHDEWFLNKIHGLKNILI